MAEEVTTRSEHEMMGLILDTARSDERIRAVILNGSRVNPNLRRDPFQDYDIVYLVSDLASFRADPGWIDRFGERVILQIPEDMVDPPPMDDGHYAYLMQFLDGNRIDLSLFPLESVAQTLEDTLTLVLLDKDGRIGEVPPPSDRGYFPEAPAAKTFEDCCNEFWWLNPYVAKALWRDERLHAKYLLDSVMRPQLMKMLTWYFGMKTDFRRSPGKHGKYFQDILEAEDWTLLQQTYSDADPEHVWDSLFVIGALFRRIGGQVAGRFGFSYPAEDDRRVTAFIRHIRQLPREAETIY